MDAELLTFDETAHVYHYDGRAVPNVTTILSPLQDFSMVPDAVLARAQRRGTAVHRACELHLLDDLDESSLDSEIRRYFWQFLKFLKQSGFKAEQTEQQIYSTRYDYAGTYDLYGILGKKRCLIDVKTPVKIHPATGPQTAAYEAAKREHEATPARTVIHRYGLQLRPDKYELVPFTNRADFGVFLALKTLYHWREKHD